MLEIVNEHFACVFTKSSSFAQRPQCLIINLKMCQVPKKPRVWTNKWIYAYKSISREGPTAKWTHWQSDVPTEPKNQHLRSRVIHRISVFIHFFNRRCFLIHIFFCCLAKLDNLLGKHNFASSRRTWYWAESIISRIFCATFNDEEKESWKTGKGNELFSCFLSSFYLHFFSFFLLREMIP